ncbi:MAG: tetratricopeptide repeat protein [Candidatus Sulfotelmatobacter sp.]|jgi:tetratricopeptide (TPR) repeat protein
MKTSALVVLFCSLSALAQAGKGNPIQMTIPGVKGILEFDVGSTTPEIHVRPDGQEVQLRAFGRPDGLEITAFLQRVAFPASAEKCRDAWWPDTKKGPFQRDNLQEAVVKDGIARVEFVVPEFQGVKVQQKNIHAYVGGGDLCAEIHLSKVAFKPGDQKLFEDLLASVKLMPDALLSAAQAQDHDSSYYFGEGGKFFLQQNYSEAANSYERALDMEKRKRTLSKDYFRVLVDNLGMSYGISGDLPQAEATFEYGLTQDPEYPMFFYNLACTYGEMDKMNDALTQLRLAYKYEANMIAGETIPDPLKDDSFRHFVDKEEFVKAVREMQK